MVNAWWLLVAGVIGAFLASGVIFGWAFFGTEDLFQNRGG